MVICFCARKGGEIDVPSLSSVGHTRLSLVSQSSPVIHVWEEAERQAQNVVTPSLSSVCSPHISSSFYYFTPPRFIYLFSLSFLPGNCCRTTPFISPPSLQYFSPGQVFSAASPGPCWETSRMLKKKLPHTSFYLRASATWQGISPHWWRGTVFLPEPT